jgi:hypothetical protein
MSISFTLSQIGFLILFLTATARVVLLAIPLFKFIKIFDRKLVEGSRLLSALEIPGLKRFIRHEVFLGFSPYLVLFFCVKTFDLSDYNLDSFGIFTNLMVIIILGLWLTLDWWRSFSIYEKLSKLYKETDRVRGISGSALDGLRYAVHLRGTVQKTVMKLGFRAMVGIVSGKLKRREKEEGKTPTGTVAISLVDRFISFPERVTGKLTDWAKTDLDDKLKKKFVRYSDRSFLRLTIIFLWGLLPSVVLTFLTFL